MEIDGHKNRIMKTSVLTVGLNSKTTLRDLVQTFLLINKLDICKMKESVTIIHSQ